MATRYEGIGPTIELALQAAHSKIPASEGKDYTVSRVLDWGMQFGGFTQTTTFYVTVEQDEIAPFRT